MPSYRIITILSIIGSFKKELLKQTLSFPEFYSYELQWNSVNSGDHIERVSVERDSTVPKSLILILNLTGCVLVILSIDSYLEIDVF